MKYGGIKRVTPGANSTKVILVIGYGNTLRSDDGVGQRVAEAVKTWNWPSVRSLSLHQLTPELAELLQGAERVIFVDACPASQEEEIVQLHKIEPVDSSPFLSGHVSDPRSLLALTQAVYNYCPPAWLITIPVMNFELGETLSPMAQQGFERALEEIRRLLVMDHSSFGTLKHSI